MSRWRFLKFDHISYCSLPQMRKALFLSPLMLIFLAACSPQAYQVNPQPDVSIKPQEIPESQREGYMRIIGDLRWDKFITRDDWIKRFPDCLYGGKHWVPEVARNQVGFGEPKYCSNFIIGGINLSPEEVYLGASSGTASGKMTGKVEFAIKDESQYRAFVAAIKDKYDAVSEGQVETHYCSRYTCWTFDRDRIARANPTPYSISILDKVKIDSSKF